MIAGKDKRAYAKAVRLIDEMRALYAESERPEDFDTYVGFAPCHMRSAEIVFVVKT